MGLANNFFCGCIFFLNCRFLYFRCVFGYWTIKQKFFKIEFYLLEPIFIFNRTFRQRFFENTKGPFFLLQLKHHFCQAQAQLQLSQFGLA